MKTAMVLTGIVMAGAFGASACSSDDPQAVVELDADTRSLNERLNELNVDLAEGARGEGVRAVHDYLKQYGYFPNEKLTELYPAWRAIVTQAPRDAGVFDQSTVEALKALQRNAGLAVTGTVDEPTRRILRADRCGVPDGIQPLDESDKYALHGSTWGGRSINWKVTNTDDCPSGQTTCLTLAEARSAAAAAFTSWSNITGLTFPQVTSNLATANIMITFTTAGMDGPGGKLGDGAYPSSGGAIRVDIDEVWSGVRLEALLLHEIGHALGVKHSSFSAATMYPFVGTDRTLHIDDNVAGRLLYDTWANVSGCATDIGVGGDDSVWITGCDAAGTVFKLNWSGLTWEVDAAGGEGARLDVSPTGVPWVVALNGSIWRRSSSDVASGSWTNVPGCARDIGIGNDGSVWIIGCGSGSNGILFKWNGSSWDSDAAGGAGSRVSVGPTGIPWVVASDNSIWRKPSNSPTNSTAWSLLPGQARDVGISEGNYAWVIGTDGTTGGFTIHSWNEQAAFDTAPARAGWVQKGGGGTQIDVGLNGRPWVISDDGGIWLGSH